MNSWLNSRGRNSPQRGAWLSSAVPTPPPVPWRVVPVLHFFFRRERICLLFSLSLLPACRHGARGRPRRPRGMEATRATRDGTEEAPAPARSLRPRRAPSNTTAEPSPTAVSRRVPLPRPTGRILIVHANGKEYGRGAGGPKASNREFAFDAKDYIAMRDSGVPYSGNPRHNKLLPLPRPLAPTSTLTLPLPLTPPLTISPYSP